MITPLRQRNGGIETLASNFISGVVPFSGKGDTTYTYNDETTVIDHEGLVRDVPKHTAAVHGLRTAVNLLKDEDITGLSNWVLFGSGSVDSYDGDGGFSVSGLTVATSNSVFPPGALSGVSITNRSFNGSFFVRGVGSDIGKNVRVAIDKLAGGASLTAFSANITLTSDWVLVASPTVTGITGNTGIRAGLVGGTTNTASACQIRYPTLEEVSGQSNQNPAGAIPVDTPVGPSLATVDSVGAGWTDNGDGTYTHASGTADIAGAAAQLVSGKRYIAEITVTGRTAGSVHFDVSGDAGATRSTNGTFFEALTPTSDGAWDVTPTTDFDGTVSFDIHEATVGFEQFDHLNGNTVTSGVVTLAEGAKLHPTHTETITTDAGQTIAFEALDTYLPWEASTAIAANVRRLPTDWATNYNRQFVFSSSGGTTDLSEPDWSTATSLNDTVTDNDITWTAIAYATNRWFCEDPAATNLCLHSETFEDAVWVASNVTVADNAVASPDGTPNAATLTATAGNGTVIQDLGTIASAIKNGSLWIQRKTGTGNIDLTVDGGATWTTVAVTAEWLRFDIAQTLADPDFGIRIVTSGDAVNVWGAQVEANIGRTSYIATTTPTVTRTSQVNALKFSDANHLDASQLYRWEGRLGVAQADIAAIQNIMTVKSDDATRGIHFDATGNLEASDGTSTSSITDWADAAHTVMAAALSLDAADNSMKLFQQSLGTARNDGGAVAYDGDPNNDGNIIIGGVALNYPLWTHSFIAVPRGSIATVGIGTILDDDSSRYV